MEINKCLFWSFHERQLKALEQFEAKVYCSFQQVAHDCVNSTEENCSLMPHLHGRKFLVRIG